MRNRDKDEPLSLTGVLAQSAQHKTPAAALDSETYPRSDAETAAFSWGRSLRAAWNAVFRPRAKKPGKPERLETP